MDEKLLFCVSINCAQKRLYGPEWKETDGGKTLIDLFLQVCGTDVLGQQVQVLVSKERAFLEAAVVQVYTPLIVLAEKSQSYIQFILTTENPKLEKHFDSKKLCYGNTLGRHETFSVKSTDAALSYHGNDESNKVTSYYGLASKPSFADMTIEEICEEIRRIKTTELSKTTLDSLEDVKTKDQIEEATTSPPVIKRPSSRTGKRPSTPVKTPPLKPSLSPAQTRTSKLRSVNSAKKTQSFSIERSQQSRPQTPKRSISPALSQQKRRSSFRKSPTVLLSTETSVTKTSIASKTSEDSKTSDASFTTPSTSKKSEKNRSPNLERLSALAKPRRRNSEPSKPTVVKKASNPIRKASIKMGKSPRVSSAKSRFVRPENSTKQENDEDHDYFVEFFTQNVVLNSSVKESSFTDESTSHIVKESSTFSRDDSQANTDYSSDSVERSNSALAVADLLDELHNSSLPNKPVSKKPAASIFKNNRVEQNITSNEHSIDDIFEQRGTIKTGTDTTSEEPKIEKSEKSDESGNQLVTKGSLSTDSHSSKTTEKKDSTNISRMVTTSESHIGPPRSPLFSPLLVKTQLRHSNKTSPEKSTNTEECNLKKLFTFPISSSATPDLDLTNKSCNLAISKASLGYDQTVKPFSEIDSSLSLSGDVPIDSLSISTSSKKNESREHDISTSTKDTSSEEQLWSNSRGIKFLGEKKKGKPLNETFVIGENISSGSRGSVDEKELEKPSSIDIKTFHNPRTMSSPCLQTAAPKTHERKHWGDNFQKMDELVIASLQAFSMELRTTSENVASNIRLLYERWRKTTEGLDDEDDLQQNMPSYKLTPRASPPMENSGIQQNMAFIFRNLRKIEVKLKTMEQATLSMTKTDEVSIETDEKRSTSSDSSKDSVPLTSRSMLNRNKSFKWKELKETVRTQTKTSSWRKAHLHHEQETSSDSDT